jgi:Excalibur calcium-binding domain
MSLGGSVSTFNPSSGRRPWPVRHPVLTAVIALIALLFVIGALAGDPEPKQAALTVADVTTSAAATPESLAPTTPAPETTAAPATTAAPETTAAPVTTAAPKPAPKPVTYYPNCAAARAAGAAPIHRGERGYRAGLDGDSDGIACENPAAAPPAAPAPPAPPAAPADPPAPDVYYANCAAARAAGAAPLHAGDAGYRSGLDRDGDGVACES